MEPLLTTREAAALVNRPVGTAAVASSAVLYPAVGGSMPFAFSSASTARRPLAVIGRSVFFFNSWSYGRHASGSRT